MEIVFSLRQIIPEREEVLFRLLGDISMALCALGVRLVKG